MVEGVRGLFGIAGKARGSVQVTNVGKMAGDEVVQLYLHQCAGSTSRPVRELKGFARIALALGEKKVVQFALGSDELSFWSSAEIRRLHFTPRSR